jgi:hypothetical protein
MTYRNTGEISVELDREKDNKGDKLSQATKDHTTVTRTQESSTDADDALTEYVEIDEGYLTPAHLDSSTNPQTDTVAPPVPNRVSGFYEPVLTAEGYLEITNFVIGETAESKETSPNLPPRPYKTNGYENIIGAVKSRVVSYQNPFIVPIVGVFVVLVLVAVVAGITVSLPGKGMDH